ncbi:nucleolar MIF4G domain-containing protein 1-like protein [Carex littledalei]|uniref:Nucleolar MIF4G domain-containing protein 1-like protein n=1 Tax=Carex littledalei TaxID=544730 RepID=A0A833QJY1_9POAL|nr:nucleolar MIF4G domain-containing protein 1-like protein [Carex littledalei]
MNTLFEGLFSDIDPDNGMNYESDEDLPVRAESPVPDKKKKQKRKQSKLQSEDRNTADEGSSEADKKRKKKRKRSKLQNEEGNTANEASTSEAGKMKKQKRKKKVVEKETKEGEETKQGNEMSEDEPVVSSSVKAKYVAPHLRATANAESEEIAQTRRRVRGLLNRLSESNVESITEEIAAIFRSVPRSIGCQVIGEEVLASCSRGPRGNEQ